MSRLRIYFALTKEQVPLIMDLLDSEESKMRNLYSSRMLGLRFSTLFLGALFSAG
jgi:hypothetical protein